MHVSLAAATWLAIVWTVAAAGRPLPRRAAREPAARPRPRSAVAGPLSADAQLSAGRERGEHRERRGERGAADEREPSTLAPRLRDHRRSRRVTVLA